MAAVPRRRPGRGAPLLRGDWHCGYDPYEHRVAPQCTPLATNAPHAVGLAHAARLKDEDTVALVMVGDGATSEGDTHAALNFAAVWASPVVFFVQNNGYAISVPLAKQTAAPSLAHKGIGYGVPGMLVDGNDAAAVYAAVRRAVASAAAGGGPTLIEAVTYRIEAHTNADDATRYRRQEEVAGLARPRPGHRGSGSTCSPGGCWTRPPSPPWTPRPRRGGRGPAAADECRHRSPTRTTCSGTSTPSRRPRCTASCGNCRPNCRQQRTTRSSAMTAIAERGTRGRAGGPSDDGGGAEPGAGRRTQRGPDRLVFGEDVGTAREACSG